MRPALRPEPVKVSVKVPDLRLCHPPTAAPFGSKGTQFLPFCPRLFLVWLALQKAGGHRGGEETTPMERPVALCDSAQSCI